MTKHPQARWGQGTNFIRFINLNTYRSMIDNIRTINTELTWRVIGTWSATDATYNKPVQGSINYGFSTKEKAIEYIDTLNHVAKVSNWTTKRKPCQLSVHADKFSNMINLSGTYRVAQYINN